MKSCKDVMDELDRYIDGDAGRMEKLSFALHMAMCGPCASYFKQYRAVRDSLQNLDDPALPDDFNDVMGRMLDAVKSG